MSESMSGLAAGVVRVFHEDSFLGSAVYLGHGCFLTCQHVAKHRRRFRIQLKAKPDVWLDATLAPNEIDHELDLAVLRGQSNEPLALSVLTWLRGVRFSPGRLAAPALAIGFPGEFFGQRCEFAPRSVEVSRCDASGIVQDYSMSQGIPKGYSGGALVVGDGTELRVLGIMQLGGREAARAVARASDPILAWLKERKVQVEVVGWSSELTHLSWPTEEEAMTQYCRLFADELTRMPVQSLHRSGAAIDAGKRLLLADVYIPLEAQGWNGEMAERGLVENSLETNRKAPTLEGVLANTNRLVVLGLPGSGKSSFLTTAARTLASEAASAQGEEPLSRWLGYALPPVPILIDLHQFAAGLPEGFKVEAGKLRDELAKPFKRQCAERFLDDLDRGLRAGRFLVLLDGLDEVPEVKRTRIRDTIREFARVFPRTSIVVTCRVRTYENRACDCSLNEFVVVHVADLSRPLQHQFIDRYFLRADALKSIPEGAGPTLAASLKQALKTNSALSEMAQTPMMLNLMCGLHGHRRLPDNRAEVYHTLVEGLLDDLGKPGEKRKSGILQKLHDVGSNRDELKRLIAELSFDLHNEELADEGDGPVSGRSEPDKERFINKSDLEARLFHLGDDKALRPGNWAQELMKDIEERAGLFVGVDDKSVKFPHRSFQEFFAGMHIARPQVLPRQGRLLLDQGEHWDEVVRWAAGYMADVSSFPEIVVTLLNGIVHPQDQEGESVEVNPRSLLVAAEIAREVGVVRLKKEIGGGKMLNALRECLLARFTDAQAPAKTRIRFGSALGWLEDPRPGVGAASLIVAENRITLPKLLWLPIRSDGERLGGRGKFWIAKYPVTVEQYDVFLRANPRCPKPEDYPNVFQTPNHPRVGVSWDDAVAFASWLQGEVEKLSAADREKLGIPGELTGDFGLYQIRLPHEKEWQNAAQGEDEREYPWGKSEPTHEHCNFGGNVGHTTPVGTYLDSLSGSPFGASDMAGNVWEWCLDTYGGNDRLSASLRVFRGGSWGDSAALCRCADRYAGHPGLRVVPLGFRLVLAPVPPR